MTSGEAARLLGLSSDMVRRLEDHGRLPAQRTTNGVRLLRRGDVEGLAAERTREEQNAKASSLSRGKSVGLPERRKRRAMGGRRGE